MLLLLEKHNTPTYLLYDLSLICQVVEEHSQPYWGENLDGPPPDTPTCGFRGEFCQESNTSESSIIKACRNEMVLV